MPQYYDPSEISEEHIRLRSYLIWQHEGCPEGNDLDHWMRAQEEIESELRCALAFSRPAAFVMPRVPISTPPCKSISLRIRIDQRFIAANAARR